MSEFNKAELENLVHDLLREAKARGATQAEADVSIVKGLSVTVRMGDVETVEFNQDRGLGVTVYFGKCRGSASTSDFSLNAVRETVAAACGIAKFTAEDDCSGLADAERMAYQYPDLDLSHPWRVNAEQAIDIALAAEAAARAADVRITNSDGASVSTHDSFRVYGNSHGFVGSYPTSRHSISCTVIAQDGGSMQRDHWYSSSRLATELLAPEAIGKRAAERAVRRLNGRQLSTRKTPVLFAQELCGGLINHLISAIRGESLYRKSSFLVDALGKTLFPSFVRIDEQPHLRRAVGSAPFDAEGVLTRAHPIVEDGVLCSYVLDTYAARKLGMTTTGNAGGVHNLIVSTGDQDVASLLKTMGTGLYVTELMGQGVNKVTGDYSRGASGFWVENGVIQYPVEEITIAGKLQDMFRGIVAIGNDIEPHRNIQIGSVLIERMTVAGA